MESGAVFNALADPTRRAILTLLGEHEGFAVGDLAKNFPHITRAAVSAHLRVLRSAELVVEQRRGQSRFYSLGPNRAHEVIRFLLGVYTRDVEEFVAKNRVR